jgi:hypothetical protein
VAGCGAVVQKPDVHCSPGPHDVPSPTGLTATVHPPAWHVCELAHESPASQAEPSAFVVTTHPLAGLHPALWQSFGAVHVTGFVPMHVPPWQASVCVHALPSLQVVPSGEAGLVHAPDEGSQAPAT